mmetsp:Transcript_57398/g.122066  ORF Transcript_57398/g.122066 Transcript_57398/m.122066 type:complete len:424 (-) Transcript_57398:195-1466(-)
MALMLRRLLRSTAATAAASSTSSSSSSTSAAAAAQRSLSNAAAAANAKAAANTLAKAAAANAAAAPRWGRCYSSGQSFYLATNAATASRTACSIQHRRHMSTKLSPEERESLLKQLQKVSEKPEELQEFFSQAPPEVRSVAASESFRALGKQNISAVETFMGTLTPEEARTIGLAALSRHLGKDFRKEYEEADNDQSGTISKVEFKRYLGRLAASAGLKDVEPPNKRQLLLFALNSAIPFVVFGALDNSIMILGGDVVDDLIGATFQLSTLACAALANTFADVFGISIGNTVEALTARLGLPQANLTPHQAELPYVRRVGLVSGSAGILVGCLIGMTPLLFMDHDRKALKEQFTKQDVDKTGKLQVPQLVKVIDKSGFDQVNDTDLTTLLKELNILSEDGFVTQKDFLDNSQRFVSAFHCRHF